MLYSKTLEAIKAHAIADYPNEACGLIIAVGNKEVYKPCKNLSQEPKEQFRMCPSDYADAEDEGSVIAVVHSHPDCSADPSVVDRMSCEQSGLPWVIVSVRDGECPEIRQFAPSGWKAPLIGRPFFHGVLDCYTMVQDVYSRELSIQLIDFERKDDWWKKGEDLYMAGFEKAGFKKLAQDEAIKPYDVILMAVYSSVANHSAVYLDTQRISEVPNAHRVPNAMIHHLYGRVSERAVYGGYWLGATRAVIRHEKLWQTK